MALAGAPAEQTFGQKESWGRVESRTSIQDIEVGVAENVWNHFGVAKRKGLGTADLDCLWSKYEEFMCQVAEASM